LKVAGEKSTWPGVKEVYRIGNFESDLIQLAQEPKPANSERLLKPVVLEGEVVSGSLPPLSEIWEFAQGNLRHLPEEYRQILSPKRYPVHFSDSICQLRDQTIAGQQDTRVVEAVS
jgi:nicotinate phosphoribosyltransferase